MLSTENVTLHFGKNTMRGGIQLQVCLNCDLKKFCNASVDDDAPVPVGI